MSQVTNICFVCLGNIVRSPLAESLFRHLAEQRGVADSYRVDSAGTSSWHVGEGPDPRMRRVAAGHGLLYTGEARQFTVEDFEKFDLIIAMDANNRSTLLRQAPGSEHREKVYLLRDFDPMSGKDESVPDPYYGGMDGFEAVYELVERSCRGLLSGLEEGEVPAGKNP